MKEHVYKVEMQWTGNTGHGTTDYRSYLRDHVIRVAGKPAIAGSSDPAFRGDPARHNPEELLVASLSTCHLLWYLHLCAVNKIVVLAYDDQALGRMVENADGSGQFGEVTLRPTVTISADSDAKRAVEMHHRAHEYCFVARSVSFPVRVEPTIVHSGGADRAG